MTKSHAAGNCQPSLQSRHGARLAPRLRPDCHVEYCSKNAWRGDPMAEASVLAAPGAYVADKSNKAVLAAAIGNLLEWYDFGVYAYLAGLIATKFFPSSDPTASLLAAFAAYGVGFLARPLGGIVIGRLGDDPAGCASHRAGARGRRRMGHLDRLHGRMGAAKPSRLVRQFPAGLDRRRLAARLGRCLHHDLVAESGGDARLGLARAVPARRTLALRRRLSAPERRRDADLR